MDKENIYNDFTNFYFLELALNNTLLAVIA